MTTGLSPFDNGAYSCATVFFQQQCDGQADCHSRCCISHSIARWSL